MHKCRCLALCFTLLAALSVRAQGPTPAQTQAAALEIIKAARFSTLVTVSEDGHPQARIVDPLITGVASPIWIGTNPLSRKVAEIKRNPRVTLLFFNPAGNEYVTVLGKATVATDSAVKAKHWKPDWARFYKEEYRGQDFMLIEVRPFRLEVVSSNRGVRSDPQTWRPVILNLP